MPLDNAYHGGTSFFLGVLIKKDLEQSILVNLYVKKGVLALLAGLLNDKNVTKGPKYIPYWTINFRPKSPFL